MPGKRLAKPKKRRVGCLIPCAVLIGLLLWIPAELYLSNNAPRLENAEVISKRLPAAFDGYRILHLSDMHEKVFGKDNETLLRLAEAANPDIIAVTGDFIQSEDGLSYAQDILPELVAIAPVFYVTGNHEWSFDWTAVLEGGERLTPRLKEIVTGSGAVWLDSKFEIFSYNGAEIVLAGLCDPNGPADEPDVMRLKGKIDAAFSGNPFTVLLSHRHDMTQEYTAAGYDVVLTGHAHGGVVRLPFTDGLMGPDREWFPSGTSGVNIYGGTSVVVSRGLGDTYAPRFLNRPQVLLVTLRRG